MKEVTAKGQTVEEAVSNALTQLNSTKDRVNITIIEEGKKGLFGLFGSRPAIVNVTLKPDAVEEAKNYILDICKNMGIKVHIDCKQEGKKVELLLSGEKIALLIGKRGQTLNSLQYLTQLVANRYATQYISIQLDAEDYRKRRNDTLIQLAGRLADKVKYTGKEAALEPMTSHERKTIHAALVGNPHVKTYSIGTEPNRYIVIAPGKKGHGRSKTK